MSETKRLLTEMTPRSDRMRAWRIRVVADEQWEMFVPARSKSAAVRKAIASVREMEKLPDLGLKGEVLQEGP